MTNIGNSVWLSYWKYLCNLIISTLLLRQYEINILNFLRRSVEIIRLQRYFQYESHTELPILVIIIQKLHILVEATHKNSGNKYRDWVKLNNTGTSNRYRAHLGLMLRFWVRFPE